MSYSVQNIRNVCLVGHSGSGKTALAESLLFMTGAIKFCCMVSFYNPRRTGFWVHSFFPAVFPKSLRQRS